MNREQRRDFLQKVKRAGVEDRATNTTMGIVLNGVGVFSPPNPGIRTGDIVQIDIEKVTARKNYDKMAAAYKEFVMNSAGKLFHAVDEGHNTLHVEEDPRWLFWSGDIIKVDQSMQS